MRGVLEGQGSDGEGYVIFPLEKTKDLSEFDGKLALNCHVLREGDIHVGEQVELLERVP